MAAGSDFNCDVDPACGGVHAELCPSPDSSSADAFSRGFWETPPQSYSSTRRAKARVAATLVQGLAAAATACLISSYMGWKVGSGPSTYVSHLLVRLWDLDADFNFMAHAGPSLPAEVDLESAGPGFASA